MRIHEKSERLRGKLAAIKGWASSKNNDQLELSDQYGLIRIVYRKDTVAVKTVSYSWIDNPEGTTLLEKYLWSDHIWESVEFCNIEKALDSILERLDHFIRSRTKA